MVTRLFRARQRSERIKDLRINDVIRPRDSSEEYRVLEVDLDGDVLLQSMDGERTISRRVDELRAKWRK